MKWTLLRIATLVAILVSSSWPARADVVVQWTAQADAIAADKRVASPVHGRALALMHVAMFEAVNAIERRYVPYRLSLIADRNTSRDAAAAAAGHAILAALYPDQREKLDAQLASELLRVPEGHAKERGLILGRKAAADLLELRARDGSETKESYRPFTQPGVYVPTASVVSPTVGAYTPWVMSAAAQFRPVAPPALTSDTWTRDLNEIRAIGGLDSTTRTAEQTTVAKFWYLTGARAWNPILQQVAATRHLDLLDCARLHALASLAGMDAYIAVFDAKYHYNFWRPVTAIRNADITGNAATPRDATWLPLGETPMHPEYPCAHCITSAAIATVIRGVVGEDIGEVSLTSPTAPGVTRKWTRLDDYRDEVSNARVWAGFHYRFSALVGQDMGTKIGMLTVTTQLLPKGRGDRR